MTRKEKIRTVQAIREGRLSIEDLEPPQVYIFLEKSTNPAVYEYNGKEYSEAEYRAFCDKIERKNNNSIIWHERKEYPKENKIIKICYGCDYTEDLEHQ